MDFSTVCRCNSFCQHIPELGDMRMMPTSRRTAYKQSHLQLAVYLLCCTSVGYHPASCRAGLPAASWKLTFCKAVVRKSVRSTAPSKPCLASKKAHLLFSPQQRPAALCVLIVGRICCGRCEVEPRDAQCAAAALAQVQHEHRAEHDEDERPPSAEPGPMFSTLSCSGCSVGECFCDLCSMSVLCMGSGKACRGVHAHARVEGVAKERYVLQSSTHFGQEDCVLRATK